jgi:DNA-binding NtrC family response regulator
MTILTVDPNPVESAVNRDFFEAYGHKVDTTLSADTALAKIERKDYDLVLIEVNLPDDGGIFLCQKCAQVKPDLPVFILTEGISVKRAIKAIKHKAVDVIFKPLDQKKLNLLEEFITKKEEGR